MTPNQTDDSDSPASHLYWDDRYRNNQTGWDMNQVSPPLKKYIDSLTRKDLKILIPGCGNAYEGAYLLSKGFTNVTLIDFSTIVTQKLSERFTDQPIKVLNDDFFRHDGKYDLILEQTFFCALEPSLRRAYVDKCSSLLSAGGKIAGVLFNKKFSDSEPPFIASDAECREFFEPYFHFIQYEPCMHSADKRQGFEVAFEFEKKQ